MRCTYEAAGGRGGLRHPSVGPLTSTYKSAVFQSMLLFVSTCLFDFVFSQLFTQVQRVTLSKLQTYILDMGFTTVTGERVIQLIRESCVYTANWSSGVGFVGWTDQQMGEKLNVKTNKVSN